MKNFEINSENGKINIDWTPQLEQNLKNPIYNEKLANDIKFELSNYIIEFLNSNPDSENVANFYNFHKYRNENPNDYDSDEFCELLEKFEKSINQMFTKKTMVLLDLLEELVDENFQNELFLNCAFQKWGL